jgi:hypothetical protein
LRIDLLAGSTIAGGNVTGVQSCRMRSYRFSTALAYSPLPQPLDNPAPVSTCPAAQLQQQQLNADLAGTYVVGFDKDALTAATGEEGVAGHATGSRRRRLQSDIEYHL